MRKLLERSWANRVSPAKARGIACAIAFHEKADRSQVRSSLLRRDTVAMLPFALSRSDSSLGAGWAFSLQPVELISGEV